MHEQEMLRKQGNNNTTERQSNTMQHARNSHFSKKNWLPRVGLKPTTISSQAELLPTELPRQLSWLKHVAFVQYTMHVKE